MFVVSEFPWYTDLNGICHSNLLLAAKTCSSKPSIHHIGVFYSLVQLCGGASSSMSFSTSPSPTHFSAIPSASAHDMPLTVGPLSAGTYDVPPQTQTHISDPQFYSDPLIDLQLCQNFLIRISRPDNGFQCPNAERVFK